MENNMAKNTKEPQDPVQGRESCTKTSTKRKFVSHSHFNSLRSQVVGMQTEMPQLVALLQDSLAQASKKRTPISDL